ncbi:MAG: hypothetical protein A2107_07555 [Verrucomicrobia bacterium GWF2_62_7]|nr:MAG: hypothetical protein A2107_07555 [Verrucomicrobia bacterium GWF2_62_7]
MIASCRVCGLVLSGPPGGSEQAAWDRLSFTAFLHLLKQHPEHVEAVCQPMIGKVANYVASLATKSSDARLAAGQQAAREQIACLLSGLAWSDATKQICFTEPATDDSDGSVQPE